MKIYYRIESRVSYSTYWEKSRAKIYYRIESLSITRALRANLEQQKICYRIESERPERQNPSITERRSAIELKEKHSH